MSIARRTLITLSTAFATFATATASFGQMTEPDHSAKSSAQHRVHYRHKTTSEKNGNGRHGLDETASENGKDRTTEEQTSSTKASSKRLTFGDGGTVTMPSIPPRGAYQSGNPVVVVVDKRHHKTDVLQKQGYRVVLVYKATNAVGKGYTPSPVGIYKVVDKLEDPSWIPPKSIKPNEKVVPPYGETHKNPLGVARIGLNKFGVNLHGTNAPGSLGKSVSHGCIRHSNKDIMAIYHMVHPGTTVVIARELAGTNLTQSEFGGTGKPSA